MKVRFAALSSILAVSVMFLGCQVVPKKAYDRVKKENDQLVKKYSDLQRKYLNAREQNTKLKTRLKEQGASLEEFKELASNVKTDETGAVKLQIPEGVKGDVQKVKVNGQTALRLSSQIFFESGSATLRDEARKSLTKIVPVLKEFGADVRYVIEGHTDNQPIKQSKDQFPTNWHLSSERAISVARHLISKGLNENRIKVVGRGSTEPIASNDTEKGRRKNRRVEIIVIPTL